MNTFRRWELSDYCRIYGRIIPHYVQDGRHFVSFHCSNREENTQTIKVDESLGEIKLVDLFGYNKSVVQINNELILCTNEKADTLEKKYKELELSQQVKITRGIQDTSYKAYVKCNKYEVQIESLFFSPAMLQNRYSMICKEDCLYPTCPFYSKWAIDNRTFQHREDYDEWVVDAYRKLNS